MTFDEEEFEFPEDATKLTLIAAVFSSRYSTNALEVAIIPGKSVIAISVTFNLPTFYVGL